MRTSKRWRHATRRPGPPGSRPTRGTCAQHIDSLADKAYWERFTPSPEFVVCFVPAEAFLDAALREDPTLFEHGFTRNVIRRDPDHPDRAAAHGRLHLAPGGAGRQRGRGAEGGQELYQRLSTMGRHIDKLGRSLGDGGRFLQRAVASLESRVFVSARKMCDLHVIEPGAELVTPSQLTEVPRATQPPS